jgi:hypothetical protein
MHSDRGQEAPAEPAERKDEDPADRVSFSLGPERWEALQTALERPARDLPGLDRLFDEASRSGRAISPSPT